MVTMTRILLKLKLRITGINSRSCDKSNVIAIIILLEIRIDRRIKINHFIYFFRGGICSCYGNGNS